MVVRTALEIAGAVDADERAAAIGIGRAVLAFGKARGVDAVAVLAGQIAAALAAGLATGLTEGAARLPADANPRAINVAQLARSAIAVALAFARSRSFHALNAANAPVAILIESAIRVSRTGRRCAPAVQTTIGAATRVVDARDIGAAAFARAVQPGIGLEADAAAAVSARGTGRACPFASRTPAMETGAAAAMGVLEAGVPLISAWGAGNAANAFADAAIGVVGTRHFERSAPGADAVDTPRGAAAGRAVSTLRARGPTCGAGAVVAVTGAALRGIGAR